jgi:hypothetical protein
VPHARAPGNADAPDDAGTSADAGASGTGRDAAIGRRRRRPAPPHSRPPPPVHVRDARGVHDARMIAISAEVRQADGIDSVRQLETTLRRHWESIPVKAHQYLVRFCDGPVLVTDELRSLRLDVVVSDERSAAHFVASFRSEVESRVVGPPVDVLWSRPDVAPQPLR